jgi:hypothetical protein
MNKKLHNKKFSVSTFILIGFMFSIVGLPGLFGSFASANPYYREWVYADVAPPEEAKAPEISIQTPVNDTTYSMNNITLTFKAVIEKANSEKLINYAMHKIYYKASWITNEINITDKMITSYTLPLRLSDIPDGNQTVTIYAVAGGYYSTRVEVKNMTGYIYADRFSMVGFSNVNFVIDTTPPYVEVLSPQNKAYETFDVPLTFSINEKVSEVRFSLDGKSNETLLGNAIIAGLDEGSHNVTLYASDLVGNSGASQTAYFSVRIPLPFPTLTVAVGSMIVVVVSIGVAALIYYRKHKHKTTEI